MRIEIFRRADGDIGVRLVARNGRKLMASEGYQRLAGAEHLANLLRTELLPIDDVTKPLPIRIQPGVRKVPKKKPAESIDKARTS